MLRRLAHLLFLDTPETLSRTYHAPANKLAREGKCEQAGSFRRRDVQRETCAMDGKDSMPGALFMAGDFLLLSWLFLLRGRCAFVEMRA